MNFKLVFLCVDKVHFKAENNKRETDIILPKISLGTNVCYVAR